VRAVGECSIGMTENGWSNQEVGMEWLRHFERHTQRTRSPEHLSGDDGNNNDSIRGYRMLIMDGHSSHVNLKFVQFCEDHKIIPICLPPHSTHLLQPLDLVIFPQLKRLYSSKVDEYATRGITGINKEYFLRILGEIYPQIYTPRLINSAFQAAGLLPYNPDEALKRCTNPSTSTRPSTPSSSDQQAMLLSSPLHPHTPKSRDDRARYAHTILHPETTPEAAEAVVNKLMEHLQSIEDREELLQVENNNLRLATAERRARKARKRQVLSTGSVLTSESMQAIVAEREAANQAKEEARL
jgi:hypothetical protein